MAAAIAAVMEHELDSVTGWRPNDFFLWGPELFADNNANRQLGIILAVRETTRVLKDHLTKVSSDQYDPILVDADTMFRNDAEKLWFPSAESRFKRGVADLRGYIAGLHENPPRSKLLNRRNVELIRLFQAWSDMLGDAHSSLYRDDVGFLHTDDVFYHAQGVAHVMYHVLRAVHAEYQGGFQSRPILDTLDRRMRGRALPGRDAQAARGSRRRPGEHLRQSPAEPRRLRQRGASEDVLDPRRAGEVSHLQVTDVSCTAPPLCEHSDSGRTLRAAKRIDVYAASKRPAAPMPPPMHIVTIP